MDHIRKRTEYDCGVAVACMLSGRPYEYMLVVADEFHLTPQRGLSARSLGQLLTAVCGTQYGTRRPSALGPFGLARFTRFAALLTDDETKPGHWIAVRLGEVYDPELPEPVPIKAYDRALGRHIAVIVAPTYV